MTPYDDAAAQSGESARRFRLALAAVLIAALAVRLAGAGIADDWPVVADPADYARHAQSIADGGGYPDTSVAPGGGPTALRPPAWPHVLGALFAATGDSVFAGRVAQALFGTAAVALLALIAWQLFGRGTALAAAVIGAVYPPWLVLDASLFSEPLFLVFELGAVAAVLQARASPRGLYWIAAAGVLTGLAVLTRSNGFVLLLPLGVLAWQALSGGGPRRLAGPALLVSCVLLTVVPWTIRNVVVMDELIPVTTQSGYTLAGAYNDTARNDPLNPGAWRVASVDPSYEGLLAGQPSEVELNGRLEQAARDYIAEHRGYVPSVVVWNFKRLFQIGEIDYARRGYDAYGASGRIRDIAIFAFYPLALLALAGAFTRAARLAPWAVWLVPAVLLTPLLVQSLVRFRAPVEPFLILLAALAVTALAAHARAIRSA